VVAVAALEAVPFYTDWLWFEEVGYVPVFLRIAATRGALLIGLGFVTYLFLLLNLRAAVRARPPDVFWELEEPLGLPSRVVLEPVLQRLLIPVSAVLALLVGISTSAEWQTVLLYRHAQPFGFTDPLFGRDVAFYVFQLPLWQRVLRWSFGIILLTLLATAVVYFLGRVLVLTSRGPVITARARAHLLGLLALLLFAKAADFWLDRYELLYSQRGAVFGATYTDVHATLPALQWLAALAALCGVTALVHVFRRSARPVLAGLVVLVIGWMVGVWAFPTLVQRLRVAPNALVAESPYIAHHIGLTRRAFALDRNEERDFPARETLTAADLARNTPTLKNVRLWDQAPLLATFAQLQEIRTYYRFVDVDNDRYTIDGEYQQVMLSARELSYQNLPRDVQGQDADRQWINEHLQYTHGYGAVVGPVNRITAEGLPELYIKDIPPAPRTSLRMTRPEIYFGEVSNEYVFVRTRSQEIDYPAAAGDENVYTTYAGRGGVPVGSFWRRLLLSIRFGSYRILLSPEITPESRVLFHRQIGERVRRIAPFLRFDADPYLVIRENGRLAWLLDGYTVTDRFPYSERVPGLGNYVRNSVKVAVDAYDGTVQFYVADDQDPIVRAYAAVFPGLLAPLDTMPADLRAHIRYPAGFFAVQARMYATYHMQDPRVFYNKEDLWSVPRMPEAGREREQDPYYTIMRIPGESREEFVLLMPFTPLRRDNMIAWLAARSDGASYGRLVAFLFPKQRLIFGPRQVAARIDQDAVISQQLTLWSQRGSTVLRGSLLAVPVDESLVYVQPLYLAAEKGSIPELKRVIVAYGNQIAMGENFEISLQSIFGRRPTFAAPSQRGSQPADALGESVSDLVGRAWEAWTRAQDALRRGDWSAYGETQRRLEEALKLLRERTPR
jgi:uncharacterized membrane protein (UPF0182 family)